MLSISNVSARQASSYYEKDGYYARLDDSDNRWFGNMVKELELPNNILKEDFDELINMRDERAGYDLCFSAPKSVSVAMCLDDTTKADMLEAHNRAVESILSQIEKDEIGARITKNKVTEHVKTGNMLCGRFNHYVSRANDPQLHTHCVILNLTYHNGKPYAVDNPSLYKNKMMYGQLYRNLLAKELMDKGYDITVTNREKGFFEIGGIPDKTLEHFSTRRAEIEKKLKEWDVSGASASEQAALKTRLAKEQKDLNVLMDSWKDTIQQIGGVDLKKGKAFAPSKEDKQIDFEFALNRMNKKCFAFTEKEFKRVALAYGVGSGMTSEEFSELFKKSVGESVIELGRRKDGRDKDVYYCTQKNLQMEKEIFQVVSNTKNKMEAIDHKVAKDFLTKIATGEDGKLKVSTQQWDAILFLSTMKDQFCAVQGLAGTGKTYMLDYTRQVLEAHGYVVKGACFTGKAANGLQKDADIPSTTLHSFLNTLEKEAGHVDLNQNFKDKSGWNLEGLKPSEQKEFWIVDEASMVDNMAMRHLMQAAELKNAKVCFVGDNQQLLPVGIGNAFSNMVENQKMSYITLDEIRRQKEAGLLKSVLNSVLGGVTGVAESFNFLEKKNVVQEIINRDERINAIVKEFSTLSEDDRKRTVVLTAGDSDRGELNLKIRQELIKSNHLDKGVSFSIQNEDGLKRKQEFSINDKVVFLKSDEQLGIQKGQIGYIEKIDGVNVSIKSINDNSSRTYDINLNEYNSIDYGYAKTPNRGQLAIEDKALVNFDSTHKMIDIDISGAKNGVKVFTDNKREFKDHLKDLEKNNVVHEIGDRKSRLNAIVESFTTLSREEREGTVVLTAGNKDRKELNKEIRYQLKKQGELLDGVTFNVKSADGIAYKREFAVGDKMIFLQNDKNMGVQNGQTGFLEKIEGNVLTIRCGDKDKPQMVTVDVEKYNYIDHGYAMTTHKAQGITENRAIINLDTSQKMLNSRNSYYVDISRARYEVKIFTDNKEEIKQQVKDFAKKLTSDDFVISKLNKINEFFKKDTPTKAFDMDSIKDFCKDTFNRISESFNKHNTSNNYKLPSFENIAGIDRVNEPAIKKPKGPSVN